VRATSALRGRAFRRGSGNVKGMRAAVLHAFNGLPVATEVPDPVRGPGQCLVRIHAAALNPVDLRVATGTFYGGTPQLPYVPGTEAAGVVVEGTATPAGTRVRIERRAGSRDAGLIAELAVVDEDDVDLLPEAVEDAVAAGLGVAGMAAWLGLEWRANLRRGETVLVLGASGMVGRIGVQAARLQGAGRVLAGIRSANHTAEVLALGADETVLLDPALDVRAQAAVISEAARGSLDVVLDPLWGAPAAAAIEALGAGGRLVNIGESAGADAVLRSASLRGRMLLVLGHSNVVTPPDILHDCYRKLAEHAAARHLVIPVELIGMEHVADAWGRQMGSPHCKLVIDPRM